MTREDANKRILLACKRTWNEKTCEEIFKALEQEPCEDAISRQALLDAFGFSEKTRKWGGDHSGYNTMMLYEIQDMIESAPPVNSQEKTGHWQHYEGMLICSECGTEFYDDIMEYCGDDVPKCCPDCGRRMIEPQEGVNK